MIKYTIYATNLYAICATLIHSHIPFEFKPNKAYGNKESKNGYGRSVVEFDIPEEGKFQLADLLYKCHEKYGDTFDITILNEMRY